MALMVIVMVTPRVTVMVMVMVMVIDAESGEADCREWAMGLECASERAEQRKWLLKWRRRVWRWQWRFVADSMRRDRSTAS